MLPTVKEKPLKSLGLLYEIPLTEQHQGKKLQKVSLDGLESIDRTHSPGKLKAWCYQHGLLLQLLRPLQVYNVILFCIQQTQQCINKYLCKWLGVPHSVSPHTNARSLKLPISSLVEEFSVRKVPLLVMMKDSADEFICKIQPDIKTGTKWSSVEATPRSRILSAN